MRPSITTRTLLGLNVAWVLLIPVWRDLHFYIAHRFLHIRAVYTYVHKLHHRNADPEPFSGMTMHPIEHLYYFSNAFVPSLYLGCLSPVIFTWNFIHLTIAPGAGHSGFEDRKVQIEAYITLHPFSLRPPHTNLLPTPELARSCRKPWPLL